MDPVEVKFIRADERTVTFRRRHPSQDWYGEQQQTAMDFYQEVDYGELVIGDGEIPYQVARTAYEANSCHTKQTGTAKNLTFNGGSVVFSLGSTVLSMAILHFKEEVDAGYFRLDIEAERKLRDALRNINETPFTAFHIVPANSITRYP